MQKRMDYYYTTLDHQTRGPASVEEIVAMVNSGTIDTSCKVAAVGTQEWVSITTILPQQIPVAAAPAPPPPPPVFPTAIHAAPAVQAAPGASPVAPTDPLAIWSLVLSLLGLFCCGFATGIPGIICGHISLSRINQNPALGGKGFAVAGLCVGYFATAAWLIYLFAMGGLAIISGLTQHS